MSEIEEGKIVYRSAVFVNNFAGFRTTSEKTFNNKFLDPTNEADYRFMPYLDPEFGLAIYSSDLGLDWIWLGYIQFRSWIWLYRPVVLSFIFVKTEITQGQTDVLLLKYFVDA